MRRNASTAASGSAAPGGGPALDRVHRGDCLDLLAAVPAGSVRLAFEPVPGDTIEYLAEIVECSELGSVVRVTSRIDEREHGDAELYYGHLEAGTTVPLLFKNDEMMRWLDALRIFDVAVNEDGTPVKRGSGPP